jgi:hypothetical protein
VSRAGRLAGYCYSSRLAYLLRTRQTPFAPKFHCRLALAFVRLAEFFNVAGRNPHDVDSVAHDIGWALVTFRGFGHTYR